jgi:hypothetical protein
MRLSRRTAIMLTVVIVAAFLYAWRFEGKPKPVDPVLVAAVQQSWLSQPVLCEDVTEPAAIYVVSGVQRADGLFEALRLDLQNGSRSAAGILLGPKAACVPFDSAEVVGFPIIELHGISLPHPTFHLFTFPGGGGPGFDWGRTATGVVHVVAAQGPRARTLLTMTVFNSGRLPEMRSQLSSNRSRRLAAFLWRQPEGWVLYLFPLT